jgi:hypothetical protein
MVHDRIIVTARITLKDMAQCKDDAAIAALIEQRCGMCMEHLPPKVECEQHNNYDSLIRTYTFSHMST